MLDKEEIVFRPRYEWRYKLLVPLLILMWPLLAAFLLLSSEANVWYTGAFAFVSVMIALRLPYNFLEEIRFGERITLKHIFLPDRSYAYADVRDVGVTGFRLRRAKVEWSRMENAEDLIATLDELIERDVIPEEQLEGKQAGHEYSSAVAGVVGGVLGFGVLVVLILLGTYPDFMPPEFFGLSVLSACWGVVYLLHRRLAAE